MQIDWMGEPENWVVMENDLYPEGEAVVVLTGAEAYQWEGPKQDAHHFASLFDTDAYAREQEGGDEFLQNIREGARREAWRLRQERQNVVPDIDTTGSNLDSLVDLAAEFSVAVGARLSLPQFAWV